MSESNNLEQDVTSEKSDTDEGRREALRKLGKYAYTAPVVMSMLTSTKASAVSFVAPPPPNKP
jgi:hypothetical protein